MTQTPRLLLFTGDGKGKTTAALGMALRASGHGMRTCVVQFVKGDTSVGEVAAAAGTKIEIHTTGVGFLPPATDPRFSEHRAAAQEGMRVAVEAIASGQFAIVVLDEICLAVAKNLVEERQVMEMVAKAGPEMCIVMTGRQASPGLIAMADTVTEMRCVKHGYQMGRPAQEGVER